MRYYDVRTTPRATARRRRANLRVAVSSPSENPPATQVSECSLLALFVAQKALEHYRGTPIRDPLTNTFEKLSAGFRLRRVFPTRAAMRY